jgi:hypothetical protein
MLHWMLWAAISFDIFPAMMMPTGGGVLYSHQVPGAEAGSDGGAAGEGGGLTVGHLNVGEGGLRDVSCTVSSS